jgi:hypothetical protein
MSVTDVLQYMNRISALYRLISTLRPGVLSTTAPWVGTPTNGSTPVPQTPLYTDCAKKGRFLPIFWRLGPHQQVPSCIH